jgi:hypothetical protein
VTFHFCPSRFLRQADLPASGSRHGVITPAAQLAQNRKSRVHMLKPIYPTRGYAHRGDLPTNIEEKQDQTAREFHGVKERSGA